MKQFSTRLLLAFIMMLAVGTSMAQHAFRSLPGPDKSLCFSRDYSGILPGNQIKSINSVFEENFSGTFPPAGWTVQGLGQTNWASSATNNAGGIAPEGRMSWSPSFVGVSRFVSPAINTTGYTTLALQFKHFVDDYSGSGYSVMIETSSNGTDWTTVYSANPTGNVGPEMITTLVTTGLGGTDFRIAITFNGDSFDLDYWYFDDVKLFETFTYDVSADMINIGGQLPVGIMIEPTGKVSNNGTTAATFTAKLEIKQGSTTVYTSTKNVTSLPPFNAEDVVFDTWNTIEGNYTAYLTVTLAGDQNPANNMISKDFQVLEGMVLKKQLLEEFTSSTCAPCAAANPIIDAVLAANPGEFSLIKYQMDWPGSGDPYYTEQGGVRKDYYGVSYVPDLYINSDQYDAGSMSQAIFDQYVDDITALDIEIESSIDLNGIITVNASLIPHANYTAGLKAHIVVVEKTTVGNVSTNGETEFHNVMMVMLPEATGTTLDALTQGVNVQLSETYDMGNTFMEEPTDLAVIVFVQDDTDKTLIQSQMVDVEAGGFTTFSVTFNVEDSDGNPVEGATVTLETQAAQTTNSSGQTVFPQVFPGTYGWTVNKAGLEPASGTITVSDENEEVNVVLNIPEFYFYEDFGVEPEGWTEVFSGWNYVYWYGGKYIMFRQQAGSENLYLISPEIDLTQAGILYITAGEANQSPILGVGTVSSPTDLASYTEMASFPVTSAYQDFEVDFTGYSGGHSYIAFKYATTTTGFFSIDLVKITEGGGSGGALISEPFEDYTAGQKLVQQAMSMGIDYWTTWSNTPGSAEDPVVSTEQAHEGANSVLCQGTNDFVMLFGDKTSGNYSVNFYIYIPSGKVGYYNILQKFAGGNSIWGSEVYFNPNGNALITANGSSGIASFTYTYNTWHFIENLIDLNADQATIKVNGVEIYTWQWSVGASGGGINQLGGMDIYAATTNGTPYFFVDDIEFIEFVPLAAPSNLVAVVYENDITLTWNAPAGKGFIGYNVYRDNTLIAEEITALTYTDTHQLPGTYMYDVKAVYDEGYSAGAGPVPATVEGGTERDMVVLEIGTGTWCVYCPGAAMGADELVENGYDVAVVEYHSGDTYETTESAARVSYYGITGFPTAFFDGVISHVGGSNTVSMYETYLPSYINRSAKVSLFNLGITGQYPVGGNNFNLEVTAENIYPYPGTNLVLHVICTESEIQENWQGQTELNFVCRDMLPNQNGTPLNFSGNPNQSFNFQLNPGTWNIENLELVAFIQDNTTKEILQGAKFDLGTLVGIDENSNTAQVKISPNPASQWISITAKENINSVRLINQLGQTQFRTTGVGSTFSINISTIEKGIYLVEVVTGNNRNIQKLIVK